MKNHYAATDHTGLVIGVRTTEGRIYTHAVMATYRVQTDGQAEVTHFRAIESWHNGEANGSHGMAEVHRRRNSYRINAEGRRLYDYDAEDLARPAVQMVTRVDVQLVPAIQTTKRLTAGGRVIEVPGTGAAL